MKFFERSDRVGDAPVAELEGWGGRPIIAGDPEVTQNNLLRVVQGTYQPWEAETVSDTPCTSIGKAIVTFAKKYL